MVVVNMNDFVKDGRFKRWAKILTNVDLSKKNGYAFEGKFIRFYGNVELEEGDILMLYEEEGSRKYHSLLIRLYIVKNGELEEIYSHKCDSIYGWALEVRDEIAKILEQYKMNKKEILKGKIKALLEEGFTKEDIIKVLEELE